MAQLQVDGCDAESRRLPSAEEVLAAARYRLRNCAPEKIRAAREVVAAALPSIPVVDVDKGSPWSAACAVAVELAYEGNDMATFWRISSEVIRSQRMASIAANERSPSEVAQRIHAYLLGGFRPKEIWHDLLRILDEDREDREVADMFEAKIINRDPPNRENKEYVAFRRRVQRIAKTIPPRRR